MYWQKTKDTEPPNDTTGDHAATFISDLMNRRDVSAGRTLRFLTGQAEAGHLPPSLTNDMAKTKHGSASDINISWRQDTAGQILHFSIERALHEATLQGVDARTDQQVLKYLEKASERVSDVHTTKLVLHSPAEKHLGLDPYGSPSRGPQNGGNLDPTTSRETPRPPGSSKTTTQHTTSTAPGPSSSSPAGPAPITWTPAPRNSWPSTTKPRDSTPKTT